MRSLRNGFIVLGTLLFVLAALWLARRPLLRAAGSWLDVGRTPQQADYVLVLGGGAGVRPFVAAALVRAGLARRVLVSAADRSPLVQEGAIPEESELVRQVLLARGVGPADVLVLGRDHRTTFDEAQALAAFLQSEPTARVTVVTSDYHTRRTRWIFHQVLGQRAGQASFVSAPSEDFVMDHWWRFERGFILVAGENLKLLFYLFRYSGWPYAVGAAGLLLVGGWLLLRRGRIRGARS